MEGYTDVMTLHQSGIENAVASSGTALTPGQIRLIKRFTDNATAVYDGDAAGMKASLRGIDLLLEEGLNVRVVAMPDGQDPDSFCKELGPEKFKQYLQILNFCVQAFKRGGPAFSGLNLLHCFFSFFWIIPEISLGRHGL